MTHELVRVLLVEDDPDDVLLLKETLAEAKASNIKMVHADRLSSGLTQLSEQDYDVVLLDLNLPDSRGIETLGCLLKKFPKIPVVVMSGLQDDYTTLQAVKQGAQDYLVKGEITGPMVVRVLRYAIERKQLHEKLETERAEASQAKDQLLAQAAHELRTPLGAALQFVTLLAEGLAGSINDEQSQYLEIVARNMKHMRAMIFDLTDVSRGLVGKLAVKQERIDVAALINRVVGNSRPKAALRDMTINVACNEEIPWVYADDSRVVQLLTNLIDNALKFGPSGSPIDIEASREEGDSGHVVVSVHDQGTSLTPEIAERIFQRLFQGTEQPAQSRQGLGLGLYICSQIVSLHGGRIWVDTDPARGTTFMFTLPAYDLAGVLHPIISSSDWLESPYTLLLVAIPSSTEDRIPELELLAIRTQVEAVVRQCIRPDSDAVLPALAGIPAAVLPVICKVDAHGAEAIATRIEDGLSRGTATIGPRVSPRVTLVGNVPGAGSGQAGTYEAARAAAPWLEDSIASCNLVGGKPSCLSRR